MFVHDYDKFNKEFQFIIYNQDLSIINSTESIEKDLIVENKLYLHKNIEIESEIENSFISIQIHHKNIGEASTELCRNYISLNYLKNNKDLSLERIISLYNKDLTIVCDLSIILMNTKKEVAPTDKIGKDINFFLTLFGEFTKPIHNIDLFTFPKLRNINSSAIVDSNKIEYQFIMNIEDITIDVLEISSSLFTSVLLSMSYLLNNRKMSILVDGFKLYTELSTTFNSLENSNILSINDVEASK